MAQKKKISALRVQPGVESPGELNPNLAQRTSKKKIYSTEDFVKGIIEGNTSMLARAITLVESTKYEDQLQAEAIINACLPHSGKSIRIGITGIPGVGKSTFIEAFGTYLIREQNKKVAVLAVDPSSTKTGGSILGDKTRMEHLSQLDNAFIRPSPSAGSLGGVARKTRETIILCEAAGYDAILVETVGVGQSETAVKRMVDAFALLLLPGAGDELQGIKRGIMEMADVIFINKSDGENMEKARHASMDVKRALRLYPVDEREWNVPVEPISALQVSGIENAWEQIEKYVRHMQIKGFFEENRKHQIRWWFDETLSEEVLLEFKRNTEAAALLKSVQEEIENEKISPLSAARRIIRSVFGR